MLFQELNRFNQLLYRPKLGSAVHAELESNIKKKITSSPDSSKIRNPPNSFTIVKLLVYLESFSQEFLGY